MLGRRVIDADRVESDTVETIGLGLLEIETTFQAEKITDRIRAIHIPTKLPVSGYEIHSGHITGVAASRAPFRLTHRDSIAVNELEGVRSDDGRVIGTSIHGLFDAAGFRRNFLTRSGLRKDSPRLNPARMVMPTPIAARPSIGSPTRWKSAWICRGSRHSPALKAHSPIKCGTRRGFRTSLGQG